MLTKTTQFEVKILLMFDLFVIVEAYSFKEFIVLFMLFDF